MSVPPAIAEQRREPRRVTQGSAMLRFDNPQPFVVYGRLMDVSASGFRMAHEYRNLESGQIVEYSHAEGVGKARVVWNRILASRVETGFLVV
jgi:hypothetical protein